MAERIDIDGLALFKDKQDSYNEGRFAPRGDFEAYAQKVDGLVTAGGEPNVIEGVKVNGAAVAPTGKVVDIAVPTAVSQLSDAADYARTADLGTAASANVESTVGNDSGLPTGAAVKGFVEGKGYQTASDVAGAIAGKADASSLGTAAAADTGSTVANDATLPTGAAVKSFVEGKGYQTASQVESAIAGKGYQTAEQVSTAISAAAASVMDYKGTKATASALPASGNKKGDVWHVTADGSEHAWDGSQWQELGSAVDLSAYALKSDVAVATNAQISALFA